MGHRLNLWLASLGNKAPEVLTTLMTLLAKGIIKPHSGVPPMLRPCSDPPFVLFCVQHLHGQKRWRCFLEILMRGLLCMQAWV